MDNGTETIGGSVDENEGYLPLFQVVNDSYGSDKLVFSFYHGQGTLGTPVEGLGLDVLTLSLSSSNTNLFSDASVPASINPFDFDTEGIFLMYAEGASNYMVSSVQAVPEPASALMLFFGAGVGFLTYRLRRWSS
ncbi:MAG: PEP-CTERM sorting domain-containing protein [Kiritimatiellales bacterium]